MKRWGPAVGLVLGMWVVLWVLQNVLGWPGLVVLAAAVVAIILVSKMPADVHDDQ